MNNIIIYLEGNKTLVMPKKDALRLIDLIIYKNGNLNIEIEEVKDEIKIDLKYGL